MSFPDWIRRSFRAGSSFLTVALLMLAAGPAGAQGHSGTGGWNEAFVGGELETYLRLLQVGGQSPLYPWSIRGFSPREVDRLLPRDSAHPWAARYLSEGDTTRSYRLAAVPARLDLIYNSAFPFGSNDGPVWAGRGLTTVLQAGFAARLGPASLVVAPVLFRAENADFPLVSNGRSGRTSFGDAAVFFIDLPQRFGDGPYTRLDPGQSTLRLDLEHVSVGVSTANQHWGPAREHPILLGNNAPGYRHGFISSAQPLDIWIGRAHARVVWGRLSESEYSDVEGHRRERLMSGLVAVFQPRGIPGLEVGGARFFHTGVPETGLHLDDYLAPFDVFLKAKRRSRTVPGIDVPELLKSDDRNQLASVFARWVLPSGGFELYGEFGKEDHNYNLRDVAVQIDQHSAYMLGFQKVWMRGAEKLVSLRGELINAQPTHLLRVRDQYPFYWHGMARQGHTQRGQLLGSAAAYGGAGSMLAIDHFVESGRWTVEWTRSLRREAWPNLQPVSAEIPAYEETATTDPDALDVIHSLGLEGLLFRRTVDLFGGIRGVYNFNRNFGDDRLNWNLVLGIRAVP